ncbi:MAG: pantoate--beta-alanine ligase [Megasphaera sp.]|jgi:pantoate--beta-alanine ligase|nr:pantoate--beta-alanine ligase [Megasphaera sp.]MCH4187550.1 pantoate--beta-alanine ligase [Megasphaera sp.]MCH4217726.1 pantoate--beta-alanine ligase [Megasphaera sp.]
MMQIFRTVQEMQAFAAKMKKEGKIIGLCPTMGSLHEGHMTLMRAARAKCDIVIASVFVNPTQFGPNEDYDAYPRRFGEDCKKLEAEGIDAVFHPEPEEMYPQGYCTYVNVDGDITHKLCGAQRPIHFRGVATVVTKLMNITRADEAFFGQKDAQQVVVVHRFVSDLNLPVHINMVPICREPSGLARSSRNIYLSPAEKEAALILSKSLKKAKAAYENGETDVESLKKIVSDSIRTEPLAAIDYVDLFSFPALEPITKISDPGLLAIAVKINKIRLIDNVILGAK